MRQRKNAWAYVKGLDSVFGMEKQPHLLINIGDDLLFVDLRFGMSAATIGGLGGRSLLIPLISVGVGGSLSNKRLQIEGIKRSFLEGGGGWERRRNVFAKRQPSQWSAPKGERGRLSC
ncbi:hypothetical protein CEXT_407471 [Caerostris extrusa]|uniref:Uncharacterized protein n=1 Tax=Caerostris extrusa TaxID=172846 RepID=A0AAV4QVD1_CAEEX|nr:hypothetical protein CEXT_407471 [Caerostris extrusa]